MEQTVCFDVETGGLNPFINGIVSITMKVVGKDVYKTWFIKPNEKLEYEPKALEVNGFSLEWLAKNGQYEDTVISEINMFLHNNFYKKPNVLGHNVVFDLQFMNTLYQRNTETLFTDRVFYHPKDTMMYMTFLRDNNIIDISRVSLMNCYKHLFGEPFDDAHSSEADVFATEAVYFELQKYLDGKE